MTAVIGNARFRESWERWHRQPANHWPFKRVHIEVVPQSEMRPQYREEYGDYWVDDSGTLQIRVREYENPDFAFGCVVHELLESWRCYRRGLPLEMIERFDADHADVEDPGRLPDAPYHREHCQSMEVERLMCYQDGYDWDEYDKAEPIGGIHATSQPDRGVCP